MNKMADLFEISRGTTPSLSMEGLRGVAVFLVFLVHYSTLSEPWTGAWLTNLSSAVHTIGDVGVDLFFVLSGYLIYGSLIQRQQSFLKFMQRRIQRIYPAFLVVLFIYIVLSFLMPGESKLPAEGVTAYILANVLLLPGMLPIEPIVTVAWSLSFEMFFYLSIPVIVSALFLRSLTAPIRVALFVSAATIGMALLDSDYARIVMFIGGAIVADAIKVVRSPSATVAFASAIAVVSIPLMDIHSYVRLSLLLASCSLLCWHCFAGHSPLTKAMSWTPLRWLGNMSYSYYLIHGLTLKAAFVALGAVVPTGHDLFLVMFVPMFTATLIPSAVLFVLVERPFSLRIKSAKAPSAQLATTRQ